MLTMNLNTDLYFPSFFLERKVTDANHSSAALLPQMPERQLNYFVDQAVINDYLIAIQLNSESFQRRYLEVIGFLSYAKDEHKILIHPYDQKEKVLLAVELEDIRHIRLYE